MAWVYEASHSPRTEAERDDPLKAQRESDLTDQQIEKMAENLRTKYDTIGQNKMPSHGVKWSGVRKAKCS